VTRFSGREVVGFNSRIKDVDGEVIGFSVILLDVADDWL